MITSLAALLAAGLAAQPRVQPVPAPAAPAAASQDLTDDEIGATVQAYLGSIDTPIGRDRWQALGPKAAAILEQLAQDPEKLPTRRARALEGLSFIGSKNAPDLMVKLARTENEPPVVRMSAMRGAGRLLAPDKLVDALRPVLNADKDTHVRAAAAEVLAHRVPSAGCASVNEQAAREAGDRKLAFERALQHCRSTVDR
jgi:HEAT repeat protein